MAFPQGGCWDPEIANRPINYLEAMAVFLGLQSFSDQVSDKHIKVLVDNTTAIACINQMGTCHSNDINSYRIKIWQWCIRHNIWLTVAHIPGKDNIIADGESRKWVLNPQIYQDAIAHLGQTPDIASCQGTTPESRPFRNSFNHHTSSRHGDVAPHGSTVPNCGDGNSIVVLRKLIPFQELL